MPFEKPFVFCDFHHTALLQSFILLFEKRFGGQVFRPIGMQWSDKGYWHVYDRPETREQFLGFGSIPVDGTPPLNFSYGESEIDGVYSMKDTVDGYNKAITYDAFFRLPIDILIATIPQHIEPFRHLASLHPNNPKCIFQIGNSWNIPDTGIVKNVMSSAIVDHVPENINYVQYHQEFDTDLFSAGDIISGKMLSANEQLLYPRQTVFSFINIFQNHPDWQIFTDVEKQLPEYVFQSFGGQCRDGSMTGAKALAEKMKAARFIWHTKAGGDGYGHIIHNAFAVGRPVIVRLADYKGKLAERLLIPDETCIIIDGLSTSDIASKINHYSQPIYYEQMCRNVRWIFSGTVDFAKEAADIKTFLHRLF